MKRKLFTFLSLMVLVCTGAWAQVVTEISVDEPKDLQVIKNMDPVAVKQDIADATVVALPQAARKSPLRKKEGATTKVTNVAKIGETEYATLAAAIAAAPDNVQTYITMIADTTDRVEIMGEKNIVLDLNGHYLKSASGNTITNYGKLDVRSSSETSVGEIDTGISDTENDNAIYNADESAVLELNVKVLLHGYNGVKNKGTLHFNAWTYYNNAFYSYVGVLNSGGTMIVNENAILDGAKYGIINDGGNVTVLGGEVWANDSYGIQNKNNGTVDIKGGIVYGKYRGIDTNGGNINVEGGTVKANLRYYSYGIYSTDCAITISDGTISSYYMAVATTGGTVNVTGGTITGIKYGIVPFLNDNSVKANINISGGCISGAIVNSSNANWAITGGHYNTGGSWEYYAKQWCYIFDNSDESTKTDYPYEIRPIREEDDIAELSVTSGTTTRCYRTLYAAINNLTDGSTVKLLKDISGEYVSYADTEKGKLTADMYIYNSFTIDLNGHTWTASGNTYFVNGDHTYHVLTIVDNSAKHTGKIVFTEAPYINYTQMVVKGGTYNRELLTYIQYIYPDKYPYNYCADGYSCVDNGDGTYSVVVNPPAPTIAEEALPTDETAKEAVQAAVATKNATIPVDNVASKITIPEGTTGATSSYMKLTLSSTSVSDQDGSKVTKVTYDVNPVYTTTTESGGTQENKLQSANSPITFRLPVTATDVTLALIMHGDVSLGYYPIKGDATNGQYVEVSSQTFSPFSVDYPADITGTIYAGTFAGQEGQTTAKLDTVRQTTPNAIIVIDLPEGRTVSDFQQLTNAVINDNGTYTCPKFVLTDDSEITDWTTQSADFYSPFSFTATAGSYTRTLKANSEVNASEPGYNSVCVPFAFTLGTAATDLQFGEVMKYIDRDANTVVFDFLEENATVDAGAPVLVKISGTTNKNWVVDLAGKTIIGEPSSTESTYKGVFATTTLGGKYSISNDNQSFAPLTDYLYPFRAYLDISDNSKQYVIVIGSKDVTAINAATVQKADGKVYSVNGQYLGTGADNMPKGIYIINGKKVWKK